MGSPSAKERVRLHPNPNPVACPLGHQGNSVPRSGSSAISLLAVLVASLFPYPCSPGPSPASSAPSPAVLRNSALRWGCASSPQGFRVPPGNSRCLWAALASWWPTAADLPHPSLSPPSFLLAEQPAAEAPGSCEEPGRPLPLNKGRGRRRNAVWRLILAASGTRKIKNTGQEYKRGGKLLRACSWNPLRVLVHARCTLFLYLLKLKPALSCGR